MKTIILSISLILGVLTSFQQCLAQTIPFDFRDGRIYLEGEINGLDSGHFILDTGADGLYIDSLFYRQMESRYMNVARGRLPGIGAGAQEVTVILDSVINELGGFSCISPRTVVMDLKNIVGCRADGIVGISFFSKKMVEINYSNHFIRISDQSKAIDLDDFQGIPFKLAGNRIFIPLKIALSKDLHVDGDFLLDLGSPYAISLTSKTAAKLNLATILGKPVMQIKNRQGGAGGVSEKVDFRANAVMMGTCSLENVVTDYSLDKSGALASDKYKGLIGNEFLRRFDVVIDFPNKVFYFRPGKEYSCPFVSNRLGFRYIDRSDILQDWIINGVYNPSEAQSAGLQTGDRITSLNGKPVAGLTLYQVNSLLDNSSSISLAVNRKGKIIQMEYVVKEII